MSGCARVPASKERSRRNSSSTRPNSRGTRRRREAMRVRSLSHGERVGVRGYGLSLGCSPSPGAARRPLPMGEITKNTRRHFSKRTLTQARNIRRPWARRGPVKAAVFLGNRNIVDAGFAAAHQADFVELPLLVAVGAMPLPGIVMPLVLKAHRDVVAVERPEMLDQAIFMFLRPFAGEERNDRGAAFEKFGALTQAAVLGICQCYAFGIARIPGVFGHAGLLGGGLSGERRKRGARHGDLEAWCGSVWPRSGEPMAICLSPDS